MISRSARKNTIEILHIKLDFLTRDLKKTSELISQLQKEDSSAPGQLALKSDNKNLSDRIKKKVDTSELEKREYDISEEIKTLEREIKKLGTNYKRLGVLYILPVLVVSTLLILFVTYVVYEDPDQKMGFSSHFVIENLRGDTIDTWLLWQLVEEQVLYVNIIDSDYSKEKIAAIRNAIQSDETIDIDDSLLHKGPKGSTSTYYYGWSGALNDISTSTQYIIPTQFVIMEDPRGGDITITLTNMQSSDGFSGFTKAIVDENQHQILKAEITIYDADKLSDEQLETIIRHEFGHALGLAHSTAPEDLMHPTINTEYPYISECDIDAVILLYDGSMSSQVVCKK